MELIIAAAKTIRAVLVRSDPLVHKQGRNGILEALKSLIQAAKANARGYRTFENFRAIICLIIEKLDFGKELPT